MTQSRASQEAFVVGSFRTGPAHVFCGTESHPNQAGRC